MTIDEEDDRVRRLAERVHGAPFDHPLCKNPGCERWCMDQARQALALAATEPPPP